MSKKTKIQQLNEVTRTYTAFDDFKDLCFSAFKSGYRPTLYVFCAGDSGERRALKFLADHYDLAMRTMRMDRVAYRC